MDPMTITSAIISASKFLPKTAINDGVEALADLGKNALKQGYNALKATLQEKVGEESDLMDALTRLEKKPDSEARKAAVQEEVEIAKINDDPEILQLAQDLLEKIKEQPGGEQVINQTQTNTVSNIGSIGGNFEFKPVQEGNKS